MLHTWRVGGARAQVCFRRRLWSLHWGLPLGLGFFCCAALAAGSSPRSSTAASAPAAAWARAKAIAPTIVERYCRTEGPVTYGVMIFRDRGGDIGGYQVSTSIMDSPVHYFDALGKPLTRFHIFGPAAERAAADRIVKALSAAFPLQERLHCPPAPKSPSPATPTSPLSRT